MSALYPKPRLPHARTLRILSSAVQRPHLPDHYATLGVADSAPHASIQMAYRRVMRSVHPDVAGADPDAATRALEANVAWSVLRDPAARSLYDRQRAVTTAMTSAPAVPAEQAVTIATLREAAARHSAYSAIGQLQREAFSAASQRLGIAVVLIGALLLALVTLR
ncbi:hypothetical protein BH23ACT9_BH23ACT9_06030 [soil metagenome]